VNGICRQILPEIIQMEKEPAVDCARKAEATRIATGTAEVSSRWLFLGPRPTAARSSEGRKIQKLLELPPIPVFSIWSAFASRP
jgi:hypothetical protein